MGPFLKVEGLGNDFILLDRRAAAPTALDRELGELRERAPELCDRRRGIGGDGILVLGAARRSDADAAMIVLNDDGSRPEMCGNGLRCLALVALGRPGAIVVDTDAGLRRCLVERVEGAPYLRGHVVVDMGPPRLLGVRAPAADPSRSFTAVSMGNPHAVAFVGAQEDPEQLARTLGPAVERDPLFPDRTNVEFAQRAPDGSFILWVWERGCGLTGACGTGACATLAAAVEAGLAPLGADLTITLPGGPLQVRQDLPGGPITMSGPARVVFHGTA